MLIAVPYFGADERFKRLLTYWFELHAASKTEVQAIVITDEQPPSGFPAIRVDTSGYGSVIRQKDGQPHPWDRKGAIVAESLAIIGPFMSCDIDAFIQRDPEPWMAKLAGVPISARADGWQRTVLGARQINAGVMWFGDVQSRASIHAEYLNAFGELAPEYAEDEWREQLAWSLVFHRAKMPALPAELNWSHHVEGVERAAIVHEHGPTKWKRIQ